MEIVHRLIDVASHMEHDNSDYFHMAIVDFKVVATASKDWNFIVFIIFNIDLTFIECFCSWV